MFRLFTTTVIGLHISEVRVEGKHKVTAVHSIIKLKDEISSLHTYLWASHLGNVTTICNRIVKSIGLESVRRNIFKTGAGFEVKISDFITTGVLISP